MKAPAAFSAASPATGLGLRPPETVMRLARLGAFHQTRLSFMRALLRDLKGARWRFERPLWEIGADGVGHALYAARGPERTYTLVCFAHDLDPALRTDRVIAEAWDATFALFDGEPSAADIARLARNVPRQEAGRYSEREIVLSRANRSVRLFAHVVESLARGRQPDRERLARVGYLMRTTAVYGNGKFGIADRARIADRPEFAGPFRAEMLTVWLIRAFTADLAEHMAAARAPGTAVRLEPALRRSLGVGNATGLGLGPFLVNHPALFDRWIVARETALARVRALSRAEAATAARFRQVLARARAHVAAWRIEDDRLAGRIEALKSDLDAVSARLQAGALAEARPWDRLYAWAEGALSLEGQELLVSLLIEPHGALVDDLADEMAFDEDSVFAIDAGQTVGALRRTIETAYDWTLGIDFAAPGSQARFWYVSEEKLEPRLGERGREPGSEWEQPLAVARDVAAAYAAAGGFPPETPLAAFLLAHPEHRHAVRRVQITARHPYAEVRDNLIAGDMVPLDLLRCKLSFFGAQRFDPKSDRWLRITLFQNAPFPDEFADADPDDWAFPPTGDEERPCGSR